MAKYNTILTLLILSCSALVFYAESKPIIFDGRLTGGCGGGGGDSCGACSDVINRTCQNQEGFTCTIYTLRCNTSGSLKCTQPGGAGSQPCYSSISRCVNEVIEDCS